MDETKPSHKMIAAIRGFGDAIAKRVPEDLRDRFDGWMNYVTQQGTNADKTQHGFILPGRWLTDVEVSAIYHFDDMGARMVDVVPQEMFRKGFICDLKDPDANDAIAHKLEDLDAVGNFKDGLRWGRCYGGGGVLLGCDDGQPASMQLIPERADDIDFLLPLDRRLLWPFRRYNDKSQPNYGKVETYLVTSGLPGADYIEVHESRIIIFPGAKTGAREKINRNGWDASVLQRAFDILRQFNTGWKAVETMMTDGNQTVFKMGGLSEILKAPGGGANELRRRMQAMDLYRSYLRAIVLDADAKEEFTRQSVSFTAIPDVLDKFMLRLSATVEVPVTILMGQSPAGMNATGESDFRWFYDRIDSLREEIGTPRVRRLAKTWISTKAGQERTKIKLDTDVRVIVKYPALWTETPTAQAQRRTALIQGDVQIIQTEQMTAAEVAIQRMRPDGYDRDLVFDPKQMAAREAQVVNEIETMTAEPAVDDNAANAAGGDTEDKAAPIPLAPTDIAAVVTVNEARHSLTLGDFSDKKVGDLTIVAYKAQIAPTIADAAAAEAGTDPTEEPPEPEPQPNPFGPPNPSAPNTGDPNDPNAPANVQPGAAPAFGAKASDDSNTEKTDAGRFDACQARTFVLQRDEDESGVSGTGEIADGVLFGDGKVAIRWRTKTASTTMFDRMADVLSVHGHAGKTRVVWADEIGGSAK